jgi:flagellar protein FlaG
MEMKNPIGAIPAVDPVPANAARSAPAVQAPPPPAPVQETAFALANARLVIEQDGASGQYVYKSLDRVTGEVLRQFPREEVLKMMGRGGYAAGAVIKTRA